MSNVWTDSRGRLCGSASGTPVRWPCTTRPPAPGRSNACPGEKPQAYAVYVDRDIVWLSDFGANTLVRFDPSTESFSSFALPDRPGNTPQILGRPGEVWGPESAADALVRLRT